MSQTKVSAPTEGANQVYTSAVYAMDLLPAHPSPGEGLPAYGDVEMLAGQLRWAWVELGKELRDRVRAPLVDPTVFWDVAVRVGPEVSTSDLVKMLLALAGALEAGRMPPPDVAAEHPPFRIITLGADPAPAVEPE